MTVGKFTFSLQIDARSTKHFIHVPLVLGEVENQISPSSTLLPLMDYAPEAQEMLKSFWFSIVFISTREKDSDTIQKSQGICRPST